MILEIKGVQFVNKGAELMLMAVLDQVRRRWPRADIALEPGAQSPYKKRARLGAYQKISARWFVGEHRVDLNPLVYVLPDAIHRYAKRRWGFVTEQEIDLVFDASGFAYGDQWRSVKIAQLAAELVRYHRAGKPYLFLPQAFGPFTRARDRQNLRRSLGLATLIVAHDRDSLRYLEELFDETPANVCQYPDFTNLLAGTVPNYFDTPSDKVLIIPNGRMLSDAGQSGSWRDSYVPLLQHAIRAIRDLGFMPTVLNHEGEQDGAICKALVSEHRGEIESINEDDPILVKGMIGAAKAVISSRFHGCVSALSQGVPCLGTSWSHKYDRLFEEYFRSEFLLSPNMGHSDLIKILRDAIDRAGDREYLSSIEAEKRKAEALWTEVEQKLSTLSR